MSKSALTLNTGAAVSFKDTPQIPVVDNMLFPYEVDAKVQGDEITIPNEVIIDFTTLEDMRYLFSQMKGWRYIKEFAFEEGVGAEAKNMDYCFANDTSETANDLLEKIELPEGFGAKATSMSHCFWDCDRVKTIHLPNGFGAASTNNTKAFEICTALTTITGNPNFKVSVDFSDCPLTTDSAMVIINGLQTVTTAQTLTLNATTLAALTDEQKAVATAKGWTLA